MDEPRFFDRAGPFSAAQIAGWSGAEMASADPDRQIADVAPLGAAGRHDLAFFDNPRFLDQLEATAAGACFVAPRHRERVPAGTLALVADKPHAAFVEAVRRFYPTASEPVPVWDERGGAGPVHPDARLEPDVVVEPGAVIGAGAEIGRGTRIMAGSVIGPRVRIGRGCRIGPQATVIHAALGDRVVLHPGVRLGQDGFGYEMGPGGHRKVPQVGRVLVQDDVEIGANTSIDRGALGDTVIGEGTKIDNHVQIGHNVVIGRHCVIVAQVGISGSVTLGDFVVLAGQVGIVPHVTIGDGAQVAAQSAIREDLAAGGRYGGVPARPARQWLKEVAMLQKLAREGLARQGRGGGSGEEDGPGDG